MRFDVTNIGPDAPSGHATRLDHSSLTHVIPLLGIIGSEALIYFGLLEAALLGHLLTFVYCTVAPLRFEHETVVFRAYVLVPVFRLINLGVPVFVELTLLWLPLVYGPLLPGMYLIVGRHSPLSASLGKLVQLVTWLPLALVLGLVVASIEYQIIQPSALIPTWDVVSVVTLSVVMVGFVGLVEELLFRGVLQSTLVDHLGSVPGIVLSALVFGSMHSAYGNPLEIGFGVAFGLVLGIIYAMSDNLGLITFIHGTANVFLYGLFPIHGTLSIV